MSLSRSQDNTVELPTIGVEPPAVQSSTRESRRRFPRPVDVPARVWSVAGWVCAGTAVVIVSFALYAVVVTGWVQHRDQARLQGSFAKVVDLAQSGGQQQGGFFAQKTAKAKVGPLPESAAVAQLAIPAIKLDQAVLGGTSASHLAEGPAWYRGSAQPGAAGNVVIAGHRTLDGAPFYRLDLLHRGDSITITTAKGKFVYNVLSVDVVQPGQASALGNFGDRRLTLVTGDPIFRESHPLVVEALLTNSTRWSGAAAPSSAPRGASPLIPEVPGDSTGFIVLALGALLVAVAALAPTQIRRRYPKADIKAAWAVAAPFVLVGVYVAFHALTTVLPSTI